MVIDRGDLQISGGLTVNGHLHIKGDLDVSGKLQVGAHGDLVVDGRRNVRGA
jgi:cytoskeletal protein CcmA (bactofilin family)